MSWDPNFGYLYPVSVMPLWLCYVTAWGLGVAIPVLFVLRQLVGWAKWSRAARAARRTAQDAESRRAVGVGPQIVCGTVTAVHDGSDTALLLVVEQEGTEHKNKNSWSTKWEETSRRQAVQPFLLTLDAGRPPLRVEPDERARLIDDLDETEPTGPTTRRRRARLTVGERVYVRGEAVRAVDPDGGYRGGESVVLRPPADGGRMLLSTRPLDEALQQRAAIHRLWSIVMLVVALILAAWIHRPFFIASAFGKPTVGEVVRKQRIKTKSGKSWRWARLVTVKMPTGQTFREELEQRDFLAVKIGTRIPVVFHKDWLRYAQVGQAAAEPFPVLAINSALLGLLLALYLISKRSSMPWYERATVEEKAGGRLPKWPPPA